VAKLSISIPKELERSVRRRVGARGLSHFAARAIRHELEWAQLGDYLAQLESDLGPVPDELLEEAREAWRRS
jgi:hypothetical protein